MPTTDTTDLNRLIDDLSAIDGHGTELVSVYVPPEYPISDVLATLNSEYSQAANIKSKRTRTNVQSALKSLRSRVRYYDTVPEQGLALFSGAIEDAGGQTSMKTVVIDDLPQPITSFTYRCGSEFETEPLESMLTSAATYGLILLDKRDAHVGTLIGSAIHQHGHISSLVPGKHKAGGQSQQRFARLRLDAINEFYKKIARLAHSAFFEDRHELQGILIGGPAPSKEEFINEEYLHHELQSLVIGTVDVGDTTERGLTEMVERGAEYFEDTERARQQDAVEEFFTSLREDTPVAYGLQSVQEAARHGAVERLLIGDGLQQEHSALVDTVQEYGGEAIVIEESFEKGAQLHRAFGGIGAQLRFPVN